MSRTPSGSDLKFRFYIYHSGGISVWHFPIQHELALSFTTPQGVCMCCGAKAAPAAKLQESRERSYLETEDSDSVETGFGHLSVAPGGGPVGFESWIKKHGWYSKQDICFFFKESAGGVELLCVGIHLKNNMSRIWHVKVCPVEMRTCSEAVTFPYSTSMAQTLGKHERFRHAEQPWESQSG